MTGSSSPTQHRGPAADAAAPASASDKEHRLARPLGLGVAGTLAVYLVVRGIVEFFVLNYSNPASYRGDWGGPSLAGVLAVHTGPGLVIVTGAAVYLRRRSRSGIR